MFGNPNLVKVGLIIVMFANLFDVKGEIKYIYYLMVDIFQSIVGLEEENNFTQKPRFLNVPLFQDWDIFLILGEEDLETPVEKESSVQKSFKKWKHRHLMSRVLYDCMKH